MLKAIELVGRANRAILNMRIPRGVRVDFNDSGVWDIGAAEVHFTRAGKVSACELDEAVERFVSLVGVEPTETGEIDTADGRPPVVFTRWDFDAIDPELAEGAA